MSYHFNSTENYEDRKKYRQYVSGLNMPIEESDSLIDIVHAVLSYFVDQAFCVQTDQITLQSIVKIHSNAPFGHATVENHPEKQTADAQSNGVESDSNLLGPSEP